MLKKLKHNTTVMMESMRKHEGPLVLSADFLPAAEHLESMRTTISTFIKDAEGILTILPTLSQNATALSASTADIFQTFPGDDRSLTDQFSNLTAKLQDFTGGQSQTAKGAVFAPLRRLVDKLDKLVAKQKEQKDSFLILESNKTKLAALQKDSEKNAAAIEQYQEKIRNRTEELQKLEADFISEMDRIWTGQFEALNRPLVTLMNIIMDLGQLAREGAESIASVLGPEFIDADYPAGPIPEKRKK